MVPIVIFEELPEVSHRRRRDVNCAGMQHFSHVLTHKDDEELQLRFRNFVRGYCREHYFLL